MAAYSSELETVNVSVIPFRLDVIGRSERLSHTFLLESTCIPLPRVLAAHLSIGIMYLNSL